MTRSQLIDKEADGAHGFPYALEKPARSAMHEQHRTAAEAQAWRRDDPLFAQWARGFGVSRHDDTTQLRVRRLVTDLLGHLRHVVREPRHLGTHARDLGPGARRRGGRLAQRG